MAKATFQDKPKIFISHAWEDKPLVRRLEAELKTAGADVWVDHEGIRGGDNLPERISNALEWCNTLLLVWSDAASASRWVKLEWTNAVSLEKAIIPCKLSAAQLPAILAHKAYLDFQNVDHGLKELLRALDLAQKPTTMIPAEPAQEVARVLHNRLMDVPAPAKPKPPQTDFFQQKATTDLQMPYAHKPSLISAPIPAYARIFDYLNHLIIFFCFCFTPRSGLENFWVFFSYSYSYSYSYSLLAFQKNKQRVRVRERVRVGAKRRKEKWKNSNPKICASSAFASSSSSPVF